MARIRKELIIHAVTFTYMGTDKTFNLFLRAVVHDYFTFTYALEKDLQTSHKSIAL